MDAAELDGYREQLREVEAELATCSDLQRRNELMDSQSDLNELIALLMEEETTGSSEQQGDLQETNSDEQLDSDDLIGMSCFAPYKRDVDRAVRFHDAIILDFVQGTSSEDLKVRVLYGHPLELAMKPCEYFLDDRCTYGNTCRYSHGEIIPLSELLQYEAPDHTTLKENSLVLVQGENKLWSSARVVALDENKFAVQSLTSGKEFAVDREHIFPLSQTAGTLPGLHFYSVES